MKSGIHPEYATATVKCACGATWQTRSTVGELHLDICSACHPFYTGKQKLVDTAGRVERFMLKWLPILPFAGFLALLSCAATDPVDASAVAPPASVHAK